MNMYKKIGYRASSSLTKWMWTFLFAAGALCAATMDGLMLASEVEAHGEKTDEVEGASPVAALNPEAFVTAEDGKFYVDGENYRYLGVNYWYACYLAAGVEEGGLDRMVKELDELQSMGVNNLRVLGASEESEITTLSPGIQSAPGVYNEELLKGLDVALDEMSKRGMKAVVYLNDTWRWSGGMSQYLHWSNGQPIPNQNEDFTVFIENITRFYTDDQSQQWFRNYIRVLLNRVNSVNGRLYKDDPTIMAWQLANEPRPGSSRESETNQPVFIKWVGETADLIRELGAKQLISTGSEGVWGCNGSVSTYVASNEFESIDYLTVHVWPFNWGWFDAANPETTYPISRDKTLEYLNQHIVLAEEMGKPLVLEEFGMPRDGHDYTAGSTTVYRDKFYESVFALLSTDRGMDGINIWSWGGLGGATAKAGSMWYPGDTLTGDNPVEPHGRNSVYSTDSSTIEVMREAILGISNRVK